MLRSAVAPAFPMHLLTASMLGGLLAGGPAPAAPPAYEGRRWALIFSDEFDGNTLDRSKWSHHYPWSRTHNHSAYSREANVAVTGGRLVLTAREESFGGKPYTTGVVNTQGKFHATHGYIEARLRMPSAVGSWPAFWMLRDGWPPEIDIMEFPLSDVSQTHNEKYRYWWNYHWTSPTPSGSSSTSSSEGQPRRPPSPKRPRAGGGGRGLRDPSSGLRLSRLCCSPHAPTRQRTRTRRGVPSI